MPGAAVARLISSPAAVLQVKSATCVQPIVRAAAMAVLTGPVAHRMQEPPGRFSDSIFWTSAAFATHCPTMKRGDVRQASSLLSQLIGAASAW